MRLVGALVVVFLLYGAFASRIEVSNRILLPHRGCPHGIRYPRLGCFTNQPPFNNTRWLPQRPSFIRTTFLLYTRQNDVPEIISADSRSSIVDSHLDANLPVKFLVHGFLQHRYSAFLVNMTRALLRQSAVNVIVVGWGGGAGFPYTQAVANTRIVGAELQRLITALSTTKGVTARQVHIIGHSLGAHVAGYAGAGTEGLGRITALDPAQPNYSGFDPVVRLDPTDARFVDVIHTDGVPYDTVKGYGMIEPVGHVDFYPNGGRDQPACHEDSSVLAFLEDAFERGMTTAEVGLSCSHERSTELFTASIGNPCHFTAFPCGSEAEFLRGECLHCGNRPCPIMGLDADMSFGLQGVFYLNTTGSAPFCGHHYFVNLTLGPNMYSTNGELSVKLTGRGGPMNWTVIKEGSMQAHEVIPKVLVWDSDIGEITRVDIKFIDQSGYFSWSGRQVELQKVTAVNVLKSLPKHFCGQSTLLLDHGHPMTLRHGTFESSQCQ